MRSKNLHNDYANFVPVAEFFSLILIFNLFPLLSSDDFSFVSIKLWLVAKYKSLCEANEKREMINDMGSGDNVTDIALCETSHPCVK